MYTFFGDAGHGWLKVPYAELNQLGIAGVISTCSFYRAGYVYLEEDSDMTKFLRAKKVAPPAGVKLVIEKLREWWTANVRERYSENSRLRTYEHYNPMISYSC